jgi:hypothetical protein
MPNHILEDQYFINLMNNKKYKYQSKKIIFVCQLELKIIKINIMDLIFPLVVLRLDLKYQMTKVIIC